MNTKGMILEPQEEYLSVQHKSVCSTQSDAFLLNLRSVVLKRSSPCVELFDTSFIVRILPKTKMVIIVFYTIKIEKQCS